MQHAHLQGENVVFLLVHRRSWWTRRCDEESVTSETEFVTAHTLLDAIIWSASRVMTRATRSSVLHDKQQPATRSTKKRKRLSDSNDIQLPPTKQPRPSPDVPIDDEHAQKILDILEMFFLRRSFFLDMR